MTTEWAAEQRQWLASIKRLDPDSAQEHIIQTFQDLLDGNIDPLTAAKSNARSIMSCSSDPLDPYDNMWGCFMSAVKKFPRESDLKKLSDYLGCLASLPDAINEGQQPITIPDDNHYGHTITIQPGEPIYMNFGSPNRHFWRDLPTVSLLIREHYNGPEAYICDNKASPEEAKTSWTTMNTFLALLMRDYGKMGNSTISRFIQFAFFGLAGALDYLPDREYVGHKIFPLWIPAASKWILIAGDAVRDGVRDGWNGGPLEAGVGDLWKTEGGTSAVDGKRWAFWERKFSELANDSRLDDPTRTDARLAGEWMAKRPCSDGIT